MTQNSHYQLFIRLCLVCCKYQTFLSTRRRLLSKRTDRRCVACKSLMVPFISIVLFQINKASNKLRAEAGLQNRDCTVSAKIKSHGSTSLSSSSSMTTPSVADVGAIAAEVVVRLCSLSSFVAMLLSSRLNFKRSSPFFLIFAISRVL
jgi:hypothetical protein